MKRSITRWTTALSAVALLGMPAVAGAQTGTSAPQPPAAQTTPSESAQPGDHLRQAKVALDSIESASVTGRAKTQLAELKRHITSLERAASAAKPASTPAAKKSAAWATDAAAVDRILTEMLGPAGTAGSSTPTPTGTSGTTTAPAASTLDEPTREKLLEVRKHVTNFAAAMSGTSASATPPAAPAATTGSGSPTPPAGTTAQQPPATTTPAETQQPAGQVDTQAARRHITEARDKLSELTQLPAAAALTGEARTSVASLISNFNELITNQTDWRASYTKVENDLTALLGPEDPTGTGGTAATGTAGAVGTSGTATGTPLDPAVRAKLTELRAKLNEFKTALGGSAVATSGSAASTASPSTTAPATSTPGTTTPGATDPSAPAASAMSSADALVHIQAIEAILNANAGAAATGTAGTTGAAGTAATDSVTLDATKLQELRTHLAELRKIAEKK
jgi:hypothetical protein